MGVNVKIYRPHKACLYRMGLCISKMLDLNDSSLIQPQQVVLISGNGHAMAGTTSQGSPLFSAISRKTAVMVSGMLKNKD
jgi:hypothetical protein